MKWILLNVPSAPLSSRFRTFFPGQLIDDAFPGMSVSAITAAGGVLWPSSDPIVSIAAAKVFASRRACGADPTAAAARLTAAIAGATNGAALGWPGANVEAVVQKFTATIGFAALAASATTQTISPASLLLPANSRVIGHTLTVSAGFTGGGLTTMTIAVGGNGGTNDIVASQSVFAAGSFGGTLGVNPTADYAAVTQIGVLFTGSGNVNLATAGSVTIDLLIALLP
jgi:hypothetical protein